MGQTEEREREGRVARERGEEEGGGGAAVHCGDWFSDENSNLVITAHCRTQMGLGERELGLQQSPAGERKTEMS